jgi:hypothetical protein
VPTKNIIEVKNPIDAVKRLADNLKSDEVGYLLPTYTAMMEIRGHFTSNTDELSNLGKVTKHGM